MSLPHHPPHSAAATAPSLTLAALSTDESAILSLARAIFHSFARGHADGYRHVSAKADRLFPARCVREITVELLETIDAMRKARRSCFNYSNPDCSHCAQRLTAEERLFVSVFGALSRGEVSAAHVHALLLCEGNETGPFLARMYRVARCVGGAYHRPAGAAPV